MVPRRFLLVLIIVTAALMIAVPASASFDITVDADTIDEPILVGESGTASVRISATSSETMVCPNGGDLTLALSVDKDGDGFVGDISPTSVTFSIPTGVYGGALDPWESSSEQTATFTASPTDEIPHLDHGYDVVATYDGSAPGDCQTSGEWQESSGTATISVTAERPPEEDETETDTNDDTQGGADTEDGPGPAVGILLVGLFAAIVARRRR